MSTSTALLFPGSPAADLPLDDVLREIFLHLPPKPRHLCAVSLVCKRWRRLVRDRDFLRCFRAFHRAPPVLGFFENHFSIQNDIGRFPLFIPAAGISSLALPYPNLKRKVVDCHHGHVVFYIYDDLELLVWDPMTRDQHYVWFPPWSESRDVTAAVVCAGEHDDHTDCHLSPFSIVFVESTDNLICTCVYSSEDATWGSISAMASPSTVSSEASTLVGDSLHWLLRFRQGTNHILEFELLSQSLTLIALPDGVWNGDRFDIRLMPSEEGSIGFAQLKESAIHFWSRRNDHHEDAAGWTLLGMVDLRELTLRGRPSGDMWLNSTVVGFSEEGHKIFLRKEHRVFAINLRSMQLREVPGSCGEAIFPYTSFYTRGYDIVGIDDRAE